ncbi:MAG: gamma-glutamyl-gamma-aminobutyrate hydrolase family protein [Chloroflexota bacterium]|nr:gamma-glutamyl-gamma-aminobutyrate hydrolase family protein [Chloroflexota bacterium]
MPELGENWMHARPVIGIPTQTLEAAGTELPRCWIMSQRYVTVLVQTGALPWLLPLLEGDSATLQSMYERLDGIFLPGGMDVDPSSYGEERHELCLQSDLDRDWTELTLVRWAIRDRKPVLGVCRGLQVVNVAAGGTLHQDVGTQHPAAIRHDYFPPEHERDRLSHHVDVVEHTRLHQLLDTPVIDVNSMHHQAIKTLGAGLIASAHAPDGIIEGVEGALEQFLDAVQWHPEELAGGSIQMHRLFAEFISASHDFHRRRLLTGAVA